jgi:cysteine desulfurase NifS
MFEIESYMTYGPIFRLRERIIPPLGEARSDYLIMAELAHRLGYGHLYPQTEEAVIRCVLEGSGFTLEDVRTAGGWVRIPMPMMEYKKWEKGGLRPDGKPGFDTPTGKFEIRSTLLEEYGYDPLPVYTEPSEGPRGRPKLARKFPLVFNSGARPHTDFHSQHHGIPGLVKDKPEPTADLNVHDAAARGISTGDLLHVQTERGAVPFRARVTEDIVQGAIECSQGGGTPVGPRAWREWNVNELTDIGNYDRISGFPVYKALLCDVVKVEEGTEHQRKEARRNVTMCEPCLVNTETRRRDPTRHIYLDNAASTPVAAAVQEEMLSCLEKDFGNPSSIHNTGRSAREALTTARRQLAQLLNCRPRRLVFTGGGSEANNLALKGVVLGNGNRPRHVITTEIEHPAVLETCRFLESLGHQVTYLKADSDGLVNSDELRTKLERIPGPALVSVMLANNEVGTIQPVRELAAIAHEHGALVHCDAVQAPGKIAVDVQQLDVDLFTVSGHKFHGPKGVGALYVREGVSLTPLIHGGKQESELRAGTENVPAIVGLGRAAELAAQSLANAEQMRSHRDRLEDGVRRLIPAAELNGHREKRLPNLLNLTLPGLRGESVVVAMDLHGISLSSGSACKSGSPEPTHVLLAMGKSPEAAHCSVRFSLSNYVTDEDIAETLTALAQVLKEMETTVRFLPCK